MGKKQTINENTQTSYTLQQYIDKNNGVTYQHQFLGRGFGEIDDVNPEQVLRDFKLTTLKRKYQKPYFSAVTDSWKMDFVIVPYNVSNIPHELHRQFRSNSRFYYLFIININTKFLLVFPSFHKDHHTAKNSIEKMKTYGFKINNIRGDYDCFCGY
jgi:hypothetical protein